MFQKILWVKPRAGGTEVGGDNPIALCLGIAVRASKPSLNSALRLRRGKPAEENGCDHDQRNDPEFGSHP